jgi:hypothetical protein
MFPAPTQRRSNKADWDIRHWTFFLPRPTNSQFVRRCYNYQTPFFLKNRLQRQIFPPEAVGTLFAYLAIENELQPSHTS